MTNETLRYHVEADYGELTRLQTEIAKTNALAGKGSAAASARGAAAFDRTARRAGFLALGLAGITGASFKAGAGFEQAMNIFEVTSKASEKEMRAASKAAIDLGNDAKLPGVSARDAGDSLTALAKGGFTAKESLEAVRGVLVLGQAAGVEFGDATTIVARSLKAFNMPATQATKIVDALAAASLASTVEIQDIADGMSYASTAAHSLGIDFTDTSTALAILNDAGITGTKAGTSLSTMFTKLAKQTGPAKREMKDLGLVTADGTNRFFDAQGTFIGMQKATKLFTGATKGLTQQQKLSALQTIFGRDAMKAASIVLGGGTGKWKKYRKAVGEAGAAEKLTTAATKGSAGAMERIKSAADTFAITFGTAVAPAITAVLGPLTRMFGFLSKYPGVVGILVGSLGGLAAALWLANAAWKTYKAVALMGAAFKGTAIGAKVWAAAQWLLNASLMGFPVILIIAALIALGVAFVVLWKKSETFRNIVLGVWEAIKKAAKAFLSAVKATLSAIGNAFVAAWNKIKSVTTTVWNAITGFFRRFWPALLVVFLGPLGLLILMIVKHWARIKALTAAAWAAIKTAIMTVVNAIAGPVKAAAVAIIAGFTGALRAGIAKARAAITAIKSAITGALSGAGRLLWNIGSAIIGGLIGGLKAKLGQVRDLVGGIGGMIKGLKGPIAKDRVLLVDEGRAIIQGLQAGMTRELVNLNRMVGGIAPQIGVGVSALPQRRPLAPAASAPSSSPVTVKIENMHVRSDEDALRVGSGVWRALAVR